MATYDNTEAMAAHVTKKINDEWGPVGEGPCGEGAQMALSRAAQRLQLTRELAEAVEEERDTLIRRMVAGGASVSDIAGRADLNRQRIYQIRDGRR